jgi:hypothetical protein
MDCRDVRTPVSLTNFGRSVNLGKGLGRRSGVLFSFVETTQGRFVAGYSKFYSTRKT